MEKNIYKKCIFTLFVLWTLLLLYGTLAPGEDLPPMGWVASIPYFDKIIHVILFFIETLLLFLWLNPKGWRCWVVVSGVIVFSGVIELVQVMSKIRQGDFLDFAANSLGVIIAMSIANIVGKFVERRILR